MIEHIILSNLLFNEEYGRSYLPFINADYFSELVEKQLFLTIKKYWDSYNIPPTKEILKVEIADDKKLNDEKYNEAIDLIDGFDNQNTNFDWLIKNSENWCQDQAIHNAIMESISIIDGDDKIRDRNCIPEILKNALSVSFSVDVGHDYFEEANERWNYYHADEVRIPFDIDILNKITNGGVCLGTLNIILAGINVGKTFLMVHLAASYLKRGLNVLYISLEMGEFEIGRRIDANNFGIPINSVDKVPEEKYNRVMDDLKKKTQGKLIIEQYPTSVAHAGHFRNLVNEIKLKKKINIDVIFVDYIGICASSRIKPGTSNSYHYIKAIAEELRGLAVEFNVPVWSASQVTRSGYESTDLDMTDTAESFGLPATADFMIAAMRTEDLDKVNQMLIKQLKNRYNNKNNFNRFVIGSDVEKQTLYDVDIKCQQNLIENKVEEDNEEKGTIKERLTKKKIRKPKLDYK